MQVTWCLFPAGRSPKRFAAGLPTVTDVLDFNSDVNFGIVIVNDVDDGTQTLFQYDSDFMQKLLQRTQAGFQAGL